MCIRRFMGTLNASWCNFQGPPSDFFFFLILRTHQARPLFSPLGEFSAPDGGRGSSSGMFRSLTGAFCLAGSAAGLKVAAGSIVWPSVTVAIVEPSRLFARRLTADDRVQVVKKKQNT